MTVENRFSGSLGRRVRSAARLVVGMTAVGLLALPTLGLAKGPPGPNAEMDQVCLDTFLGNLDRTASANDPVPDDVPLALGTLGVGPNGVFFGVADPFASLVVDVGIPGSANGRIQWQYWDGNSWKLLPGVGGNQHFLNAGAHPVTFASPANWASRTLDAACPGLNFYLYGLTDYQYTIIPVASQVWALN